MPFLAAYFGTCIVRLLNEGINAITLQKRKHFTTTWVPPRSFNNPFLAQCILIFQGFVSSGYGVNGIGHVSTRIASRSLYEPSTYELSFSFANPLRLQNAGPAPSPLGQIPPNESMPGGPMAPNFFPVSSFPENTLLVAEGSITTYFPIWFHSFSFFLRFCRFIFWLFFFAFEFSFCFGGWVTSTLFMDW